MNKPKTFKTQPEHTKQAGQTNPKRKGRLERLLATFLLTALALLPSFAFAALSSVTTFVCGVGESLTGPLGLAIGFVILAGGGIALAIGGRRALGTVLWATIGIIVTLSAGALVTSLFGSSACGA